MNLQEMTNEQLSDKLYNVNVTNLANYETAELFVTIKNRLCAPKQPYQIKYKFLPNDRDIEAIYQSKNGLVALHAVTVWGTSPLNACQTLVDAMNCRGQDMEFVVTRDDVNYHYMSHDLE